MRNLVKGYAGHVNYQGVSGFELVGELGLAWLI